MSDTSAAPRSSTKVLREVALLFLRLGTISFGGPAAHIAMMEDEVVKRRKWITHEYFLDLLGATNIIPGPNSTEMGIHIGYIKAGWKGLVLAGVCFILPAVTISIVFAHLYVLYGSVPQINTFIWGIRSAVIAVILAAVIRLGKPQVKNRFILAVSVLACVMSLLKVDAIVLLGGAGFLGLLWGNRNRLKDHPLPLLLTMALPAILVSVFSKTPELPPTPPTISSLGLFFLKIGSILYGSGYVLAAFLQGGLVDTRALAHTNTAARRHCRRAVHPRACALDCNLYRIFDPWISRSSGLDGRHLSSIVHLRPSDKSVRTEIAEIGIDCRFS